MSTSKLNENTSLPTKETKPTTCQPLTGRGRSAVAVIRVDGPRALDFVRDSVQLATPAPLLPSQVRYGIWQGYHAELGENARAIVGESVVVTPISDSRIEVHCHGGVAAVDRILNDLSHQGALRIDDCWSQTVVDPADITDADRADADRAEVLQVLCRCTTERMAAIVLDQLRGTWHGWLSEWRNRFVSPTQEAALRELLIDFQSACSTRLQWSDVSLRLHEPFRLALVGPPNAGKSTLMNALLGWDRSITFNEPGTTRDVLHGWTVLDGIPLRVSDSAGIRDTHELIEQEGIRRSLDLASSADLVLELIDATVDQPSTGLLSGKDNQRPNDQWIRVLNKCDLKPFNSPHPNRYEAQAPTPISALSGAGLDELKQRIVKQLESKLPPRSTAVPVTPRHVDWLQTLQPQENAFSLLNQIDKVLEVCLRSPA